MKLTIYTKTICPQCNPVKAFIKSKGLAHEMINIDEDETAYETIKGLGFQSTPVVTLTYDTGEVVQSCAGMQAMMGIMKWNQEGLLHAEG